MRSIFVSTKEAMVLNSKTITTMQNAATIQEAIDNGIFSHDPENQAEFLIHPDGVNHWYLGRGKTSDNLDLPLEEVINTDESGVTGLRLCHVCPAKELDDMIRVEDFEFLDEKKTKMFYPQSQF